MEFRVSRAAPGVSSFAFCTEARGTGRSCLCYIAPVAQTLLSVLPLRQADCRIVVSVVQ